MSQSQNPVTPEITGQSVTALEQEIEKLENKGKERKEAQELQQALKNFNAFKNNKTLKKEWKREIERLKEEEKSFAKSVVDLLKNVAPPVDADTRKRATAALSDVPPSEFDCKKISFVALGLLIVVVVSCFVKNLGNPFVFVGLVVAAAGQICESIGKVMEVQSNPRLKDGLELSGEAVKILGVIVALGGFALGS